jgi:hypothetical protein
MESNPNSSKILGKCQQINSKVFMERQKTQNSQRIFFETGSHYVAPAGPGTFYVAQIDLELTVPLSQSSESWDNRHRHLAL